MLVDPVSVTVTFAQSPVLKSDEMVKLALTPFPLTLSASDALWPVFSGVAVPQLTAEAAARTIPQARRDCAVPDEPWIDRIFISPSSLALGTGTYCACKIPRSAPSTCMSDCRRRFPEVHVSEAMGALSPSRPSSQSETHVVGLAVTVVWSRMRLASRWQIHL
jgi:hypothetical protein